MLKNIEYNRKAVLEYAKKWAFKRNPLYYDFESIGGDCTNFVSQCIFAGCHIMNFTPIYGWYYCNSYERSASWTGVDFLYNFLIDNKGIGPYAIEVLPEKIKVGDIIQLGKNEEDYYHSLIVTKANFPEILVASHSDDSYMRPISTYKFKTIRFLHIVAARIKSE